MDSKFSSPCKCEVHMENSFISEVPEFLSHMEPMKIGQNQEIGIGATFTECFSLTMGKPGLPETQCTEFTSAGLNLKIPYSAYRCKMYSEGSNLILFPTTGNGCDIDTSMKPKYAMKSHVLNPDAKEFIPFDFRKHQTRTMPLDLNGELNKVSEKIGLGIGNHNCCSTSPEKEVPLPKNVINDHISRSQSSVILSSPNNDRIMFSGFRMSSDVYDCPFIDMPAGRPDNSFKINSSNGLPNTTTTSSTDIESLKSVHKLDFEEESSLNATNKIFESVSSISLISTVKDKEKHTVEGILNKKSDSGFSSTNDADQAIINKCNEVKARNIENGNIVGDSNISNKGQDLESNISNKGQDLESDNDSIVFSNGDKEMENDDGDGDGDDDDDDDDDDGIVFISTDNEMESGVDGSGEESEDDESSDDGEDEDDCAENSEEDDSGDDEEDESESDEDEESDDDITVYFTASGTKSNDETEVDDTDCDDNDDDINSDYCCDLFQVEFSDNEFTLNLGGLLLGDLIPQNFNSNKNGNSFDSLWDSDESDEVDCNGLACDLSMEESKEVVEANKRWNENIDKNSCSCTTPSRVQFSDDVEVFSADDWCRKSFWEVVARDRMRFQRRIEGAESILNPILSPEHRCKILNRLTTRNQ